jgi:hypothetical protein
MKFAMILLALVLVSTRGLAAEEAADLPADVKALVACLNGAAGPV